MPEQKIQDELRKLAEFIVAARRELFSINAEKESGDNKKEKNLTLASNELNEVIKHTEDATNKIMDESELIQKLCSASSDKKVAQEISKHTAEILVACSFQDITGQRIRKVLRTLEEIEIRVGNMVKLFGGDIPDGMVLSVITGRPQRPDEHLMEGPQLKEQAKSQAEIDKIFKES